MGPDPLDGWALALGYEVVGSCVDVRFGDAAGYAKSPALPPYSIDNLEAVVLQFVVDHVQRRSTDSELAWELPPPVD